MFQSPIGLRRIVFSAILALASVTLVFPVSGTLVFAASTHTPIHAIVDHPFAPDSTCGTGKCGANCGTSSACTPPLHYNNGVIQHNPHIHLIFWGSKWASSDPIITELINTFSNLAGSSYNAILTQYYSDPNRQDSYIRNDAQFNAQADISFASMALPQRNLTMQDIGQEAAYAVSQQGWSTNTDDQFLVFPQQGEQYSSAEDGFCGSHSWGNFQVSPTQAYALSFGYVRYLSDFQSGNLICDFGYQGGPKDISRVATHEYAETATNAQPPIGTGNPFLWGWATTESNQTNDQEIGDLCNYETTFPPNDNQYQAISATYLWSNADNGCVAQLGNSQEFPSPGSPNHHTVKGKIFDEYNSVAMQNALGEPINEEYPVPGFEGNPFSNLVRQQDFQNGSIYWKNGNSQAYEVQGSIYKEYTSASVGGPTGKLGFPVSDELPVSDANGNQIGRVSFFAGQLCGSLGPQSSGSEIVYNGKAHEVQGCIYHKYWSLGGPAGMLGFPVTDEQSIAGGHVSYFAGQTCNGGGPNSSGSAIFDSGNAHTDEVHGCIYHAYQQGIPDQPGGNGPTSAFGFPTSDEQPIAGGHVSYFAGPKPCNGGGPNGSGSAIFGPGNAHAYEVHGCIYGHYESLGGPGGSLGFPTSNEIVLTSSPNSWVSHFAGTNCSVSPYPGVTPASGSSIYSSPVGTFAVQGCIYQTYIQAFGGSSGLGWPISDEYSYATKVTSGRESDFQAGCLLWDPSAQTVSFAALQNCPGYVARHG